MIFQLGLPELPIERGSMPKQKPGRSRQDYGTPPTFLTAVKSKLGVDEFSADLAANKDNSVAPIWFGPGGVKEDALAADLKWNIGRGYNTDDWQWLNPPFANITPWVKKAYEETAAWGSKIAMLVPASVGAEWWKNWVDGGPHVLFLNGRLTFVGETAPYPKDCALLLYNRTYIGGYEVWNWRQEV